MPKFAPNLTIDVNVPQVLPQIKDSISTKANVIPQTPKNFEILSPKMQQYLVDIDEVIEEVQEESGNDFKEDPIRALDDSMEELQYYQKKLLKIEKKSLNIENTMDVIRQNYDLISRLILRRLGI